MDAESYGKRKRSEAGKNKVIMKRVSNINKHINKLINKLSKSKYKNLAREK